MPVPYRQAKRRAAQVGEGPWELEDGELVRCEPGGGRHGETNATGTVALITDPAVDEAGVDVGYAIDDNNMRAPDLAIGNVPREPGWVEGVPPLAVEYADEGGDEAELQKRIARLLSGGTRFVWVVRLTGPRRVEVHTLGGTMQTLRTGEELEAPGVLRNRVPVDALFDRDAAHEVALRNLLQRKGYRDLDAVRAEAAAEGAAEPLRIARSAIQDLCEALGIEWNDHREAAISTMDAGALDALRLAIKRDRRWPD